VITVNPSLLVWGNAGFNQAEIGFTMHTKKTFISWVGRADLDGQDASNLGAIARILLDGEYHFDDAYLLLNSWLEEKDQYQYWLQSKLDEKGLLTRLYIENIHISSPIDYSSIYRECDLVLRRRNKAESEITLALTSGTPAMIAIWLLLGKGVYNTNLVQVSREHGIQEVTLPFDVSLAYLEQQDSLLKEYLIASPEVDANFGWSKTISATD